MCVLKHCGDVMGDGDETAGGFLWMHGEGLRMDEMRTRNGVWRQHSWKEGNNPYYEICACMVNDVGTMSECGCAWLASGR